MSETTNNQDPHQPLPKWMTVAAGAVVVAIVGSVVSTVSSVNRVGTIEQQESGAVQAIPIPLVGGGGGPI